MRVIGGELRSRRLLAPAGSATRPSSDRLRETLFNVLSRRIEGCRFADLYAGSGAVGIEAISRGAATVLFVEKGPPALRVLRQNLVAVGLAGPRVTVEERSVATVLGRPVRWAPFDVVFLDPPYEAVAEYTATLGVLGGARAELLRPGAWVVAEHASRSPLPERFGRLTVERQLRQGDATLSFYAASKEDVEGAEGTVE